ncbi:MAG: hypothetical protein ACYTAF_04170 [Planctomycetota bacterium]
MKTIFLLPLLALLAQDPEPRGRTRCVTADGDRIDIVLPVAGGTKSVTAVVSLPEDGIDSIVVSWDEKDLSLERHRGNLFLKLLRASEGDVHVVGASGRLYRLFVRAARAGEDHDTHVRIEIPKTVPRKRTPAVELVRAMRLGRVPPDVTVRSSKQILLRNDRVTIVLRHVYDSPRYAGAVVTLKNRTSGTYRVDPSRFSSEGLVLIGSQSMVVGPGATTKLYLVFWK